MQEAFQLYTVKDALLTQIGDQLITDEMRLNGVLLRPSEARWFIANGMLEDYTGEGAGPVPVRPITPVPLSELFAPSLENSDDGKSFIFKAINGRLLVIEFVPEEYVPPDDPGDLSLIFKNALI